MKVFVAKRLKDIFNYRRFIRNLSSYKYKWMIKLKKKLVVDDN